MGPFYFYNKELEYNSMSDKIVIVGATGYTGSTLALSLSKDEVSCHLVGRDHAKLQDLASKTNSSFVVCNIEDDQSVKDSLDTISNDKIVG
ncbi:MAG: NAD-dependent epimerase/dehydratase family protein, partial [Candidatus Fonsibacter sp.]